MRISTLLLVGTSLALSGNYLTTFAQTTKQAKSHASPLPEIVVGHVSGYTGPVAKDSGDIGQGAQVLFDAENARGGVNGRHIRLVVADDNFKADNTLKLVGDMKGKVVALLPTVGSANLAALVKVGVLETPMVGTIPSPEYVRKWENKNIFHIRASDQQQTERILDQLITVGTTNIAILVSNNPFGEQATKLVGAYLENRKLKLAAVGVYTLVGPKADFTPGLKALEGKSYQALIMFGPPQIIADSIKALKAKGETAQLYTLSFADSNLIVQTASLQGARGVVISQVMPNLNTSTIPLIKAFQSDFAKYSKTKGDPSYYNLEGYVSAKLIVEAIRRTKDASPEGVRRGLEQMRDLDLGGYIINFSPTNHEGSSFVDLSMINSVGRLVY
jgi:ABC-type branched-subunit amino acid transport system substrate-binding protein